jgi:hypothetical protein
MCCLQTIRAGFCSLSFSFRLVNCTGRSLRRRQLQTFRFCRTNLWVAAYFGLFQGLGLHCLWLGREALLNGEPWQLWDRMAILRQGFSRQDLERGRSRTLLPWHELGLSPAMLAELSPPMPPAAAARLELTLLMRFSPGCG